ncbi:nuclear transport factor 2 family protein [Pandoraea norimbergensis]
MSKTESHEDIAAVELAEHALARAHLDLTAGLDVIESLLHPDYVIIQPGGVMETKADVLASYRTGTRHWDTAQVDQLRSTQYGETIIVVGRWCASGHHGATWFDYQARFVSVWIKTVRGWQNITYQSTEITV